MTLAKAAIAKPRLILGVRDLVREDLEALKEGRTLSTVQRFKDPHHRLARMFASGLRTMEVQARSGYTYQRLTSLYADPAFQELISHYRKLVDAAWVESVEEAHALGVSNMVRAEKHVAQRLDEAEEAGEAIPIKDALAISRDGMDRFGLGKKSVVTNINVDFASQLEKAIKRSGKQIDVTPQTLPTGATSIPTYNENPRVTGPPQHAPHAQQVPQRLGSHPQAEELVALAPFRPKASNAPAPRPHPSLEPIRRRA